VWSGDTTHVRLSRGGNRQVNAALRRRLSDEVHRRLRADEPVHMSRPAALQAAA